MAAVNKIWMVTNSIPCQHSCGCNQPLNAGHGSADLACLAICLPITACQQLAESRGADGAACAAPITVLLCTQPHQVPCAAGVLYVNLGPPVPVHKSNTCNETPLQAHLWAMICSEWHHKTYQHNSTWNFSRCIINVVMSPHPQHQLWLTKIMSLHVFVSLLVPGCMIHIYTTTGF